MISVPFQMTPHGHRKKKWRPTLDILVRHLFVRAQQVYPTKIWGPLLAKFLGTQWWDVCEVATSAVVDIWFLLQPRKPQLLLSLFGFWEQYILHFDELFWLIYWVTPHLLVLSGVQDRRLCITPRYCISCAAFRVTWPSRSRATWVVRGRQGYCLERLANP